MVVASDAFVVGGRYKVGIVLGRGGMGEVRHARDLQLHRDVAIKFLRSDLAAQESARQRFEDEARSAAALHHANVVQVFDAGEHEGRPYLVMECLPGKTLRDEIGEGPLTQARAEAVARDVLAALAAAHTAGVVHRDVSPSNILLADTGRAKLGDFGIAKAAESADVTTVGLVIGTAAFMAPERLRGEPATPAADIYSLGVTLNQATGARRDGDDGAFARLVDRMMDPDPQRRPSAAAALEALERGAEVEPATEAIPIVATEPVPVQTMVTPVVAPAAALVPWWQRARNARLLTVGIAAVVGVLLLLATAWGRDGSRTRTETTPSTSAITVPTTLVTAPTTFAPPPGAQTPGVVVDVPRPKGKEHHGKDGKP